MARFIKHRDITCSFPGCPRLARNSQNDHPIPSPKGRSTAANMDSQCTHHHQGNNQGGHQTLPLPPGARHRTTPQCPHQGSRTNGAADRQADSADRK